MPQVPITTRGNGSVIRIPMGSYNIKIDQNIDKSNSLSQRQYFQTATPGVEYLFIEGNHWLILSRTNKLQSIYGIR